MALLPLGAQCSGFLSQKPACPIARQSQSLSQGGLPIANAHFAASSKQEWVQRRQPRRWKSVVVRSECCLPEAVIFPEQSSSSPQSSTPYDPPTYVKAPGRIIAIGDIHGDLQKAFLSLALAGVLREGIGREPIWCGGDTTVVQLGDVLDRGAREIGVIMLLRELDAQARKEGGAVYMLNGNHESMNISGNFRYASEEGMMESALVAGLRGADAENKHFQVRARAQLFSPGQPMALELAKNPTALIVNRTLFAHGGVFPHHVAYGLERINAEMAAWMRGEQGPDGKFAMPPFEAVGGKDGIVWTRAFGKEHASLYERIKVCNQLKGTLQMLGVEQMVVGHTPQTYGANCACNGQVWRMDVGMSSGVMNTAPQVLDIMDGEDGKNLFKILSAPNLPFLGTSRMLNSMAPFKSKTLLENVAPH